jgi:hypothetical protein
MHLTLEPIAEALRGDLDGHFAPHARIEGAVHLTHAARADERENLVGPEPRASRERHKEPVL